MTTSLRPWPRPTDANQGADVVVTGEEAVLQDLLAVLAEFGGQQGATLSAFVRAREAGALKDVPGLVYAADGRHDGLHLVNTGIQRLLRDLDVLPLPTVGFATLEPAHKKQTLSAKPLPLEKSSSPVGLMPFRLMRKVWV